MPISPLASCPDGPGAYVVAVTIAAPITVRIGRQAPVALPAGRYLYCGSAYGPGGMRSRLARHFRHDKTVRWHVDQLTTCGVVIGAWAVPLGDECDLVRRLGFLPVALAEFGATDCAQCRSHLLRWPRRVARATLAAALAAASDRPPQWIVAESIGGSRARSRRDTSPRRRSPATG